MAPAPEQKKPQASDALRSIQVLVRFSLRMLVLCFFTTLGSVSFSQSMIVLLGLSAILCGIAATLRGEPVLSSTLTYWDEGAAYSALYCLAIVASQTFAH